jgi:ubiquinone/menaquinone biosynthesis C-methylase UbiE
MSTNPTSLKGEQVKQCCAQHYQSEVATFLLGECFHPGGLRLTERLGERLGLSAGSQVLDVAAGRGTSALFLAEHFDCEVTGIDYGAQNVAEANRAGAARGLDKRVHFQCADAESLPFETGRFDALVCECAFCTFPDKGGAAAEFARVLRVGGRLGLTDLTRIAVLPEALTGLLAWIACIADAQPLETYVQILRSVGFIVEAAENHDEALRELVRQVQGRMLTVEVLAGLKQLTLSGLDLTAAKQMSATAAEAIARHELGYALIVAAR